MSDDLAEIHEQASALLEKLYDDKGQPDELDDDFVQEYFTLVQGGLNLDVDEEVAAFAPSPHNTSANLSQADKGLIDVSIPSKTDLIHHVID